MQNVLQNFFRCLGLFFAFFSSNIDAGSLLNQYWVNKLYRGKYHCYNQYWVNKLYRGKSGGVCWRGFYVCDVYIFCIVDGSVASNVYFIFIISCKPRCRRHFCKTSCFWDGLTFLGKKWL
jgi:hypothetical protein